MTTLKPTAARMVIPALMLSVLPLISSCQKKALYVSTKESKPHELAAYDCDGEEVTKEKVKDEEECDETMEALAVYLEDDDDDCATNPAPYCYQALTLGMPAPNPCPSSSAHCIPFWGNPRICFYSEADKRPVEIFVNGKRIGTARDVSYDPRKKLRTVYFDLKKNLKSAAVKGPYDLNVKIPVTYPGSSAGREPTGDMMQTQLEIAAKF
jgi:hypothetical protein